MSNDNKNDIAVVSLYAFDAQGEQIDRVEYTGRYEPATAFLEFMMHIRKTYPKAVRFTAEVVFAVMCMVFLSSTRVEAGNARDNVRSYTAVYTFNQRGLYYPDRDILSYDYVASHQAKQGNAFETGTSPVLWLYRTRPKGPLWPIDWSLGMQKLGQMSICAGLVWLVIVSNIRRALNEISV